MGGGRQGWGEVAATFSTCNSAATTRPSPCPAAACSSVEPSLSRASRPPGRRAELSTSAAQSAPCRSSSEDQYGDTAILTRGGRRPAAAARAHRPQRNASLAGGFY
jgi:hypothetical protein